MRERGVREGPQQKTNDARLPGGNPRKKKLVIDFPPFVRAAERVALSQKKISNPSWNGFRGL